MHSYLFLHFYRISPNWRVLGEKLSCCPEWNILILWPSGRHSKVFTNATLPLKLRTRHLDSCDTELLLFGLQNRQCDCVCSADDLLCIVMEYCGGGDLLQRIRQQKTAQFCVDDVGMDSLQLFLQFYFPVLFSFKNFVLLKSFLFLLPRS